MSRYYRLLSAILTFSACAYEANAADVIPQDNIIYAGDMSAKTLQQVSIPINMRNSVEATAYSFSIVLPQDIQPSSVNITNTPTRKTDNVVFDFATQSDGSIMALCYSSDGTPFSNTEGEEVARVKFTIPETMTPKDYTVSISQSEISESGVAHRMSVPVTSTLSVTSDLGEMALTDGVAFANEVVQDFEKVTYTRTFRSESLGTWQAFYVPFSFNIADYSASFDLAEIFVVCPVKDTDGDGDIDSDDDLYIVLSKKRTGITLPNAPYMIFPRTTPSTPVTITAVDDRLYAAERNRVYFSTSIKDYYVEGFYQTFTVSPGDDNYYINIYGQYSTATTEVINVGPYRWIMHETPKSYIGNSDDGGTSSPSRMRIAVLGEDLDEETALQFIQADAIQSCAGADNVIYNLNGVRVDDSNSLPAGIYVKNGKTFMIR